MISMIASVRPWLCVAMTLFMAGAAGKAFANAIENGPSQVSAPLAPETPRSPDVIPSTLSMKNPIIPCQDRSFMGSYNTEKPWKPNGADSVHCFQTVMPWFAYDFIKAKVATKNGRLVGAREDNENTIHDERNIPANYWIEQGYTSVPGELWWGRSGDKLRYHVVAGQETYVRYLDALRKKMDMRAYMAVMQGKALPPFPHAPQTTYRQVSQTQLTSEHYLGGPGFVPNGTVSNAVLRVNTALPLTGTLELDVAIENMKQHVSVPLKRRYKENGGYQNGPALHFQMVHGHVGAGGKMEDCISRFAMEACEFPVSQVWPHIAYYRSYVSFYGPQSNFAVVRFEGGFGWNTGKGSRSSGTSTALIVLQAQ